MNPGLVYLLIHEPVGRVRQMGRRMRTFKGAFAAFAGGALLIGFVTPTLVLNGFETSSLSAEAALAVRRFGPPALLAFTALALLGPIGALVFRAPIIQFLFTAPLSRREILLHHALSKVPIALLSGVWMAIFLGRYSTWYASTCAAFLFMLFTQLSAQAFGITLASFGEFFARRARVVLAGVLALLGGAAILVARGTLGLAAGATASDRLALLTDAAPMRIASLLTRPFVEVYLAQSPSACVAWSLVCASITIACFGYVIVADFAYTEYALTTTERAQERLQRIRTGGLFSSAGTSKHNIAFPSLRLFGDAGTVAWRQCQEMIRHPWSIGMGGFLLFTIILPFWLIRDLKDTEPEFVAMTIVTTLLVFFPMISIQVHYDFQRDLDRVSLLKSWPIPTFALAAGQMLAGVLLATLWQWVGFAVTALLFWSPNSVTIAMIFLLAPLTNWINVAIQNFVFLLLPYRLAKGPGETPFVGRMMAVMFVKTFSLALICGAAGIFGLLTWSISGSTFASAGVVGAVLLAACIALTTAVAWAFDRFDVSEDVPD